jgi:XTP/dITP diphosphohydrolase
MTKLLIASNNSGKLKEYRTLLRDFDFELLTPFQPGIYLQVDENGQTYKENALLKAVAFARESGCITLADDSGLEVDALNGLPGIHSARFSPKPGANDADRRAYLLEKLRDKPRPWTARFCCSIVLVSQEGDLRFSEGYCYGEIIPEERGQNGFGYDPIFLIPKLGRTMAELSLQEKNQLSHRALAVQSAKTHLRELLGNPI